MAGLHVTPLLAALFALLQVPITMAVGLRRLHTGIPFLDAGDEPLLRRMRAHGNFTETVPMALIVSAAAELQGTPVWLLVSAGVSLIVGRAFHYATLVRSGFGIGRAIGMVLTLLPLLVLGSAVLVRRAW